MSAIRLTHWNKANLVMFSPIYREFYAPTLNAVHKYSAILRARMDMRRRRASLPTAVSEPGKIRR